MARPPRQRRALGYVGGVVETEGGPEAKLLKQALDVPPHKDSKSSLVHVHGFHTYSARMHPLTAGRLVNAFSPPGGRVLDPFCGSGTVLVEALLSDRLALGSDLNPLAVRLTRCKTLPRSRAELENLVNTARDCAGEAEERRRTRAGAHRRFPAEDARLFEPHVLLELDSLRQAFTAHPDERVRYDLSMVFSSILVKLSRQRGDTSKQIGARSTAPGFASRLFVRKTEELAERLHEFTSRLPSPRHPAVVELDDATSLKRLPGGMVDAIVTSPPYAATYDYVEHHALRLRWLGLDAQRFATRELGSRSSYRSLSVRAARSRWSDELHRFLTAAAGRLPSGGTLVLVMADSAVGDTALRADEIVANVAATAGFAAVARASQRRAHFHHSTQAAFRTKPRAEHALLLRRS